MAVNKRSIKSILKKVEKEKAAISLHRDKLRDLVDELSEICDHADTAVADLDHAADSLSQLL